MRFKLSILNEVSGICNIYNKLHIIKKCNLLFVFLCSLNVSTQAQSYDTAIGLRMGDDFGYTIKQRVGKKQSLEMIYSDGMLTDNKILLGIFEHHMPLLSRRFNVYMGAGYGVRWNFNGTGVDAGYNRQSVVPIVIGGELSIGRFNISTDIIPLYILDKERDRALEKFSAISIRYILFKRKPNGIFKKINFKKLAFWNKDK